MRLFLILAAAVTVTFASPQLDRRSCNHDNCLRAMIRSSTDAAPFCSTYTTATASPTLPAWATACSGLASRLSSGCSCLNTPTATATPTTTTSTTPSPTKKPCLRISHQEGDIVVDNSANPVPGSYPTMQQGISALSSNSTTPQRVFIYPGSYVEQVYIKALKSNLTIQGYTTDCTSYKSNAANITYNMSRNNVTTNDLTATVRVWNPNTKFYNLNILNTFGHTNSNGQNLAVNAAAGNQGYYGMQLIGYQDTVLANLGNQLYAKSLIVGAVDFIFGQYATAWFEQDDIRTIGSGYITASGRATEESPSWYVINNSTVDGLDSSVPAGSMYLGRPWKPYARAIFQNSYLGAIINPAGWSVWSSAVDGNIVNSTLAEYSNYGPGSILGEGPRANNFSVQVAAPLKIENVLGANFRDEWWVDTNYL